MCLVSGTHKTVNNSLLMLVCDKLIPVDICLKPNISRFTCSDIRYSFGKFHCKNRSEGSFRTNVLCMMLMAKLVNYDLICVLHSFLAIGQWTCGFRRRVRRMGLYAPLITQQGNTNQFIFSCHDSDRLELSCFILKNHYYLYTNINIIIIIMNIVFVNIIIINIILIAIARISLVQCNIVVTTNFIFWRKFRFKVWKRL